MGAKVDNTPRFVVPRIIETKTGAVSLSKDDSADTKKTIYTHSTGNKRDFVTVSFGRSAPAQNVKSAYIYLNGDIIGNTKTAAKGFSLGNDLPASRTIVSEAVTQDTTFDVAPLILEDGDVISLSKAGTSGSDPTATVFTITVNIWG